MMKEGKLDRRIPMYLTRKKLSDMYNWTPNQINEMDLEDMLAYIAIDSGREEAKKEKK